MKLLAFDTATEACSCALHVDGETQAQFTIAPQKHAELILNMVNTLLAEAELIPSQLDGLAYGRGPGSFTGLRIASGVAQGIAFGADLSVASISSLATLAQGIYMQYHVKHILTAFDARMEEVYWGCYTLGEQGIVQLHEPEIVCKPQAIPIPQTTGWYGAGSGWASYAPSLLLRLGESVLTYYPHCFPNAQAMIPLALVAFQTGQVVSAEQALPVYLRDQVVQR
jgi:tRNA threonylcarbamoyladenosine biosynthesis protein TsaB